MILQIHSTSDGAPYYIGAVEVDSLEVDPHEWVDGRWAEWGAEINDLGFIPWLIKTRGDCHEANFDGDPNNTPFQIYL